MIEEMDKKMSEVANATHHIKRLAKKREAHGVVVPAMKRSGADTRCDEGHAALQSGDGDGKTRSRKLCGKLGLSLTMDFKSVNFSLCEGETTTVSCGTVVLTAFSDLNPCATTVLGFSSSMAYLSPLSATRFLQPWTPGITV